MSRYEAEYRRSLAEPEAFWAEAAEALAWHRRWDHVLDRSRPPFYRWFAGGQLNMCENALDRHVAAGRGEPARADLRQPGHGHRPQLQLRRGPRPHRALRRRARRAGRPERRPRPHLHADGARDHVRDAGLRAHRRDPLGGVRRLRRERAGHAHRRRPAARDRQRLERPRGRAGDLVQAAARRGDRAGGLEAGGLRDPAAPDGAGGADAGPGSRLERAHAGRQASGLRAGGRHRPAVHPLHLGHDRDPEGCRARPRRLRGRAGVVDAADLRRGSRRGLLGGVGSRLGGRPLVHRVRAAPARLHDRALRGQAGGHARRRRLLARDLATRRVRAVHRADRVPRHQARRPRGGAAEATPDAEVPRAVPGRRARRSGHHPVGRGAARRAGDRSLVADRDRLAGGGQLSRPRQAAGQARQPGQGGAGLGRARGRRAAKRSRVATSARWSSSCRCRRAPCPRCGARTSTSWPHT